MELLENHFYDTNYMQNFFGVTKENWKKKRERLLLHLQQYYEYEILYDENDHRKKLYHIIKEIKHYEPPKGKRLMHNEIYLKQIIQVIETDNRQTARNISRIIKNHKEIMGLNHADGTIYEYVRVNMRNMFGTKVNEFGTYGYILGKTWCTLEPKHNIYVPLNDTQINFLFDTYKNLKIVPQDLVIYEDYEAELITKEELEKDTNSYNLDCFIEAKRQFKAKYDYFPIKVPEYQLSAFEHFQTL